MMYPERNNRKVLIIILILATLGLGIASIYTSIRLQNNQDPVDTSAQTQQICTPSTGSNVSSLECANLGVGSTCTRPSGIAGSCQPTSGQTGSSVQCFCQAGGGSQPCAAGLDCTGFTGQALTGGAFTCSVGQNIGVCCNAGSTIQCGGSSCTCVARPACDTGELCGTGVGCGSGAACSESAACNQECELNNGVRTGYIFTCLGSSVQRVQATQTCPPPVSGNACDGTVHCSNGSQDCGESGLDCGGGCNACQTGDDSCTGTTHCSNGVQDCSEGGVDCGSNCNVCQASGGSSCTGISHCSNGLQDCDESGLDCGGTCSACVSSGANNNSISTTSNLPSTNITKNLPYYYIIGALILFGGMIFVFRKKI